MSERTVLGVDPGIRGALGLITLGRGWKFVDSAEMPIHDVGKTTRVPRVDYAALAEMLRTWRPEVIVLEHARAMPGGTGKDEHGQEREARSMGATSAFNYGHVCGSIEVCCGLVVCEPQFVVPQVWKRAAGLPKREENESISAYKRRSRTLARELWPDAPLQSVKSEALAEALLIARFGLSSQAQLV